MLEVVVKLELYPIKINYEFKFPQKNFHLNLTMFWLVKKLCINCLKSHNRVEI